MKCHNHPDREAITNCSICGKPICNECYMEIAGNVYCKECVNDLVTKSIVEKAMQKPAEPSKNTDYQEKQSENTNYSEEPEKKSLENIKPIEKPQEIPHEQIKETPKGITEEIKPQEQYTSEPINPANIQKEEKVDPVEEVAVPLKSPENYEPDIEYEPEYVETYGSEEDEDTYYQNSEKISEIEPEKYNNTKVNVIEPINSEKQMQNKIDSTPEENYIKVEHGESISEITPDAELEAKYEKYLEDLYYDEPDHKEYEKNRPNYTEELKEEGAMSLRAQLAQDEAEHGPLTKKPYVPFNPDEITDENESEELSEGLSNNYTNETYQDIEPLKEQYQEPKERYQEPKEEYIKSYSEEQYHQPQEQYKQFGNGELPPLKPVQSIYRDEEGNEYIIPITQEDNQNQGYSYDEIKRRIEEPNTRRPIHPQYQEYPEKRNIAAENAMAQKSLSENEDKHQLFGKSKKPQKSKKENLENIQKIHRTEEKQKDEKFTKTEIFLTIILIILIIAVIFYVIYLFTLSGDYPTFMDALWGLIYNPSTFISNLMS